MSDHVLVTGGIGLIGNAVRQRLEDRGDKVIAIDRGAAKIDGREVIECDVTDAHGLYAIAHCHPIRAIVHCGAFSGPMVSTDHPMQMIRVNIGGTANVGKLARVLGNVRLVFASTATAYGETPKGTVPENTVMEPDSMYGASKAASEQILNAYKRQFGVDTVSIRLTWVYGPRRTTACLIRKMLTDALAGRPTHIPYGRDFPRQYIHLDDAADAMVAALDHSNLMQQAYNISGGSWLTLSEVADTVMKVVPGARIEVSTGDDPGDVHQGRFDISAAERDLGYVPKISLEEGVKSYLEWLKANGDAA
jgi:UDP-glucuronate 4-epimerase